MQRRVLEYAVAYQREHGRTPLLREIADEIGVTAASTVHEHLRKLQAQGWVRMKGTGFELCDSPEQQIYDAVKGCACEGKVLDVLNAWDLFVRVEVP